MHLKTGFSWYNYANIFVFAMQEMQKGYKKTAVKFTWSQFWLFLYFRHFNVEDFNGGKIKINAIKILILYVD